MAFEEALAVARSLNLASRLEWKEWSKAGMRPPKVPADPENTHRGGGWQGWGHWARHRAGRNHIRRMPLARAMMSSSAGVVATVVPTSYLLAEKSKWTFFGWVFFS